MSTDTTSSPLITSSRIKPSCGMFLRSALFNVLFYVNLSIWLIAMLPTLVMPRAFLRRMCKVWIRSFIWLMQRITRLELKVKGVEHLPKGGYIVASKHQSLLETFALYPELPDAVIVLKKELMWIPLFGWYMVKLRMIPVQRGGGKAALKDMSKRVKAEIEAGRQVIIFPEGTRTKPNSAPAYKNGVIHLYNQTHALVAPVALNTGLFWPRRQFLRYEGTVTLEFLPPITSDLPRDSFMHELQTKIETASERLFHEGTRQLAARHHHMPQISAPQA
jgi:1-acyl-sn-glycerol-3-phosphate acyltransferase